jgi:hypothetical protein
MGFLKLNFEKKRLLQFSFVIIFIAVAMLSLQLPFFWDQILYSKIACWLFDTNFSSFILPSDIDFGHSPLFGVYIALFWKILGKSLISSHIAMIPILAGIAWQYSKLASKFFSGKYLLLCLVLLLAEPTILAQSTMVSTDITMLFFYLLAINCILDRKILFLILSIIVLSLINIRGICISASLLGIDLLLSILLPEKFRFKLRWILSYIIGALIALSWYYFHYLKTGWMFFVPQTIYKGACEIDGLQGIIRNVMVVGFNLIEYGRIFLWAFVCFALIKLIPAIKHMCKNPSFLQLMAFALIPLFTIAAFVSLVKNPIGPRYFIVIYLNLILLFVYLLKTTNLSKIKKYVISVVVILGLSTGHLWIFPEKVANGWDSTLAHLPYFQLRTQMKDYLVNNKFDVDSIGTRFPISYDYRFTDLSDSSFSFHNCDLETDKYILYSNIINDFSDEEIDQLKQWKLIKEYSNCRIFIRLYQK